MDRLETLLTYYDEDPDDAFTRFAIATEYLKRNNFEKACLFFEELVRDNPSYVGTYYHLGKLYESLNRNDEAIATYQNGISIATEARDLHARAELQDALLSAQGIGFDD